MWVGSCGSCELFLFKVEEFADQEAVSAVSAVGGCVGTPGPYLAGLPLQGRVAGLQGCLAQRAVALARD